MPADDDGRRPRRHVVDDLEPLRFERFHDTRARARQHPRPGRGAVRGEERGGGLRAASRGRRARRSRRPPRAGPRCRVPGRSSCWSGTRPAARPRAARSRRWPNPRSRSRRARRHRPGRSRRPDGPPRRPRSRRVGIGRRALRPPEGGRSGPGLGSGGRTRRVGVDDALERGPVVGDCRAASPSRGGGGRGPGHGRRPGAGTSRHRTARSR